MPKVNPHKVEFEDLSTDKSIINDQESQILELTINFQKVFELLKELEYSIYYCGVCGSENDQEHKENCKLGNFLKKFRGLNSES